MRKLSLLSKQRSQSPRGRWPGLRLMSNTPQSGLSLLPPSPALRSTTGWRSVGERSNQEPLSTPSTGSPPLPTLR
ncbi:unnamed protein product [Cuscuta campestris]|uniref:Uncharacterized protein n=1 Tax=Cuscuta campestris TaxID=132261 RepID=A0A484K2D0_9ASTE|nr:unnamed protein product [Cuscuta campestris]